jgi:hypothetical protein
LRSTPSIGPARSRTVEPTLQVPTACPLRREAFWRETSGRLMMCLGRRTRCMTRIDGIPKRRFLFRPCAARELEIYRAFYFNRVLSPLLFATTAHASLVPRPSSTREACSRYYTCTLRPPEPVCHVHSSMRGETRSARSCEH